MLESIVGTLCACCLYNGLATAVYKGGLFGIEIKTEIASCRDAPKLSLFAYPPGVQELLHVGINLISSANSELAFPCKERSDVLDF